MINQSLVSRINGPRINLGIPMTKKHALDAYTPDEKNPFIQQIAPVLENHPELDIYLPLDQITKPSQALEVKRTAPYATVIDNNSKPIQRFRQDLSDLVGEEIKPGKGINVHGLFGLILSTAGGHIAIHDGDITTYSELMLRRLTDPIQKDPSIDFLKANFIRYVEKDGIRIPNGRANYLFVEGFLRTIKELYGDNKKAEGLINSLLSYKYKLAGEVGLSEKFASQVQITPGYGMETDMLIDFHKYQKSHGLKRAQTYIGQYDHDHQSMGNNKGEQGESSGLSGMAESIAASLFYNLKEIGIRFDDSDNLEQMTEQHIIESKKFVTGEYKQFLIDHKCVYNEKELFEKVEHFSKSISPAYNYVAEDKKVLRLPAWTPELKDRYRSNFIEAILELNPERESSLLSGKKIYSVPAEIFSPQLPLVSNDPAYFRSLSN
ncbi:hypothetical protein ISS05_02315 [Candidatus Woesearchaeota archaeon]|nr:hypothetical protein [Candidatus Woesearchaeota archaeon]